MVTRWSSACATWQTEKIKAHFSENVINHISEARPDMQKLDNLARVDKDTSFDHLKMLPFAISSVFSLHRSSKIFSSGEIFKTRLAMEKWKGKKSHYSFALCHSDDSLSAALLSSSEMSSWSGKPSQRERIDRPKFFMQISSTWENCTHYKWSLATASMLDASSLWENSRGGKFVFVLREFVTIAQFEWRRREEKSAAIAVKGKLHDYWQFVRFKIGVTRWWVKEKSWFLSEKFIFSQILSVFSLLIPLVTLVNHSSAHPIE